MMLRKLIFWIHLIAGVAAGLVIFIMAFTGVLMAYEKQIVSWTDRNLLGAAPPADAARLPLQSIVDTAESSSGTTPATFTFYSGHRAVATAAGASTIYVDSYSGEKLGTGSAGVRNFFRSVTNWHRYLAMSGGSRPTGKSITGVANLLFLLAVIVGLFLWIPKGTWNLRSIRNVAWFRRNLGPKARNFNWHNVFGIWAFVPLFFIALSGTVISFPWASNLVYRAAGTTAPNQNRNRQAGGGQERRNQSASSPQNLAVVDPLLAIAERQVSNWKTIRLQIPTSDKGPVNFTIDRGDGGDPTLRSTLTMDRSTGEVLSSEKFEEQDAGRRARSWFRFVHTGEYYGLVGQAIAAVASFAACMLVWTGFVLSWRRLIACSTSRKLRMLASELKSSIGRANAA